MNYQFKIISNLNDLPADWEEVVACKNILLSKEYFEVLQYSKPENMVCYAVAFYKNEELIGGALFQYLDFQHHRTFQRKLLWCDIRNLLTKNFSKDVLIIGNNMLTGQHGFNFNLDEISPEEATVLIEKAVQEFQKKIKKTSLIIFKDFQKPAMENFNEKKFADYFRFSVQPNMILNLQKDWEHYEDYTAAFSKKYRDRAKTAKRKFDGLEKRELQLFEVEKLENEMQVLYHNVAENAPFNTFFLTEKHFAASKKLLGGKFQNFCLFFRRSIGWVLYFYFKSSKNGHLLFGL